MSRKLRFLDRRIRFGNAAALPLCLLLSACGGGSDGTIGVANIPSPPPTPTPTPTPTPGPTLDIHTSWLDSPATREGSYDLLGRLTLTPGSGGPTSYRAITPGEFTMTVPKPGDRGFRYSLNVPAGILPAGLTSIQALSGEISWDINLPPGPSYKYSNPYGDMEQFLGQRMTAFSKAPDGSETQFLSYDFTRGSAGFSQSLSPDKNLRSTVDYDMGFSYVAMGEWSWRVVDLNGAAAGDFGDLLFVQGDRTPASGIPASGTATYDARTLALWSGAGLQGIPFTLSADFGQRTMSTRIDQDYRYTSNVDGPILGIHVGGSSPFSNSGTFDIPLTGTANYSSTNSPVMPPTEPVTGAMNGAFFGPQAEQVGGVFSLGRRDGTLLMQDAFVGQHH